MKQVLRSAKPFPSLSLLSVALLIVSGGCVTLPRHHTSDTASNESPNGQTSSVTININIADVAELDRLPGIGPVLAQRIVTHRQEHGPFRRAEHLIMVRGMSDRKFRAIRSKVRVE